MIVDDAGTQRGAARVKRLSLAILAIALGLFAPAAAQACRIPMRPEALRGIEAEAVVLVLITDRQVDGENWRATAVSRGTLMGRVREREFRIDNGPVFPGVVVVSCRGSWPPKLGRYGILYLQRAPGGQRVYQIYPYWWARASGDPRLARLDRLLPLGGAREPTAEEERLLDLAEPRIALPPGVTDLTRYTRVYARVAPGSVTGVLLLRSGPRRRLIVDDNSELPTEASCRCRLISVRAELDDLLAAGQLPPFNP